MLDKSSLKAKIETELQAQGIKIDGEHAWASKLATAIANAVVNEITANGEVVIQRGSSAGNYKVV